MGVVYSSETAAQAHQAHKTTSEGNSLSIKGNEQQNRF